MNILEKLAELACTLDKKGLHEEASELDNIIKEAAPPGPMGAEPMPGAPGAGGLAPPPPGMKGIKDPNVGTTDFVAQSKAMQARQMQKIRRRFRVLNNVRDLLGLSKKDMPKPNVLSKWRQLPQGQKTKYSPYDREFAAALKQHYPNLVGQSPIAMYRAIKSQKDTGVAGKAQPTQQPGAAQPGAQAPGTPVERSREQGGASFDAAQAQAGAIWQALVTGGKSGGKSRADIAKRIEQYMGQGMSPEAAAQKVKQEYGV